MSHEKTKKMTKKVQPVREGSKHVSWSPHPHIDTSTHAQMDGAHTNVLVRSAFPQNQKVIAGSTMICTYLLLVAGGMTPSWRHTTRVLMKHLLNNE